MTITISLPLGYKPVFKHGDHDQSSHGSWASGNFQDYGSGGGGDLDILENTYSERYGFDNDGNPKGTTVQEINRLIFYTGEGYRYINNGLRGLRVLEEAEKDVVDKIDKLLEEAPNLFGDKNLYRVYSDRVLSELEEGDIVTDKGYLSTTRIDLTEDADTRRDLGNIGDSKDTVAVILPSENKTGKGISVDAFFTAVSGVKDVAPFNLKQAYTEREVLLPRNTSLKFIGMKRDVNNEAEVAVFQRLDK